LSIHADDEVAFDHLIGYVPCGALIAAVRGASGLEPTSDQLCVDAAQRV
jgi:hypothetical protein